jgi:hypothetical protein
MKVSAFRDKLVTTAIGVGEVKLRKTHRGHSTILVLSHVLHIPSSRTNLVSQIELNKHNICALLGKGKVELMKDNIVFANGWIEKDMYRINADIINDDGEPIINNILDAKVGADFCHIFSYVGFRQWFCRL